MTQQLINITPPGGGTGDSLYVGGGKINANFTEIYSRVSNAADFGAVADGVTPVSVAINAAIAAGVKTLVFDQGTSFYAVFGSVALPSGFTIMAGKGRPKFKLMSSSNARAFTMGNVSDTHIFGIALDGNIGVAPADAQIIINNNSSKCSVEDCFFTNLPGGVGGVVMSSGAFRNLVKNCQFDTTVGTAISITGANENIISHNQIRNYGGWGIGITNNSGKNIAIANHITTAITGGGECIVTQYDCLYNRIIGNHCELSGDNGISISGNYGTVVGNVCLSSKNAGIGIWGRNNTISSNIIQNSNYGGTATYWAGIWVQCNYGSTGCWNTIVGNSLDDSQTITTQNYGVRLHGNGYNTWAQGQNISNLNDYTQLWRIYGLNIYRAANTGITGATPPTHTSGTVSDGAVSWTYVDSFVSAVGTLWNQVSDNIVQRSVFAPYFDSDNWQRNVLYGATSSSAYITADGLVKPKPV